jgi:hypothetical protein
MKEFFQQVAEFHARVNAIITNKRQSLGRDILSELLLHGVASAINLPGAEADALAKYLKELGLGVESRVLMGIMAGCKDLYISLPQGESFLQQPTKIGQQ